MSRSIVLYVLAVWISSLFAPLSGVVHLEEIQKLKPFCTELKSKTYCTEQCRTMANMAIQRICQDREISREYMELKKCEDKGVGICSWFRCKCFDPHGEEPDEKVSLSYCKKRLYKYFKLNEKLGTSGFEEY